MAKHIWHGREAYFLGINHEDEKVYMPKPSWDCDWYWGFGYLQTHNSHTHFDSAIINGKSHSYNNFKEYFKETPLTDEEIWTLCDYMNTFYTLRRVAELYHLGYSHYTERAYIDILKDTTMEDLINNTQLPALFEKIDTLLS